MALDRKTALKATPDGPSEMLTLAELSAFVAAAYADEWSPDSTLTVTLKGLTGRLKTIAVAPPRRPE
jgi:hypothetical protein